MQRVVRSTLVGLLTIAGLTACGDKITVPPPTTAAPDNVVRQVVVSPQSVNLNVGQSVTLAASVDAGAGVTNRTVTWTSSDATVASVTAAGVVKGEKAGVATITAASVADPNVKGAAVITVGGQGTLPPQVLITGLTQGGTNMPINIAAAAGQIDVVLDVQTNGSTLRSVSATMTCPGSTTMTQTQGVAGAAGSDAAESAIPVVLSFPTNAFTINASNVGVPTLRNGSCSISASATTGAAGAPPQTATTTTQLTLANASGIVFRNSFTAIPNAEGITPTTTQANDQFGLPWRSGSVTVLAIPVLYGNIDGTAQTLASVTLTLPGASNTGTVTLTAAPFSQTWSANANSGPRVVQSIATCAPGAANCAVTGFEVNGQTPLPVTPVAQAVDGNGNNIPLITLPGGTATSFRLDNQSPQAPLMFNIPGRQSSWVNASYTFTGAGSGNNNGNVATTVGTTGSANYVSCGDGPSVQTAPGSCQVQQGVSGIGQNNAAISTNSGTNANMTYSFYVIPLASYTAASATNGTSISATSCSTTGWTKVNNAGDVSAASTSSNAAFVVRIFETDKLGNARCADLSTEAVRVGTVIQGLFNTGAGTFPRGNFGVDRVVPTATLVDPATDPTAAGANQQVGIGGVTPNFLVALSDDASGFSATPITTMVTRLAVDPATNAPSTVNSAFGCPIAGLSNNVCSSGARGSTVPADAGSGADASGCVGCGYFTYTGTALDLARNAAPTLTRQVAIDRTSPTMGSIAVPAALTGGASASFATSAQDNLDIISWDFTLAYPVSPVGNPVASFPIRSVSTQIHAPFSGTLITAQTFNLVAPSFIRTMNATGAGNAPPNSTGFLPASIAARVTDAGNNVSAVNPGTGAGFSNIAAAAINQTNLTNFSVSPNAAQPLAVMQTFAVTNAAANISNCPDAGCAGGVNPANPTTVNLTAASAGAEGPNFQFANPFTSVQFYYFDPVSAEYILIGSSSVPTVTDNATATVRTFTWTFPAWNPPASLGVGAANIVAVGVNSRGDALASAVNVNITLTNP